MKFCYNINFTLPKQSQRSRSILQDGSRSFGSFWKEKTLSYNRRNTVLKLRNAHAVAVQSWQIQHGNHTALVRAPYRGCGGDKVVTVQPYDCPKSLQSQYDFFPK